MSRSARAKGRCGPPHGTYQLPDHQGVVVTDKAFSSTERQSLTEFEDSCQRDYGAGRFAAVAVHIDLPADRSLIPPNAPSFQPMWLRRVRGKAAAENPVNLRDCQIMALITPLPSKQTGGLHKPL